MSLRAKLEQVHSTNSEVGQGVQVATLAVQVVQVAQECHLLAVACLPQEWTIDHQVHLAPMALIVALMVGLMVVHMVLMDLQDHMVLLGLMVPLVPMDLTVDIMVVRQAHMDHLVWGRTTGHTKDLLVDLPLMACKALDPEVLLLQATFKDLYILVDLVGLHLAMVAHLPVDHHQIWDLPRVNMDPHHHVALLHPLTQGLRHPDRTL